MEQVVEKISVRTQETVRWICIDIAMLVTLTVLVQLWSNAVVWNEEHRYAYAEDGKLYRNVSEVHAGRTAEHMHIWKTMGLQSTVNRISAVTTDQAAVTITEPAAVKPTEGEVMRVAEEKPVNMERTDTETTVTATLVKEPATQENILPENSVDNTMKHAESDEVTDRTATDEVTKNEEMIRTELLELNGFVVNENGVIESCKNPAFVLKDGIIIFPADERCSGIGSEALNGIASAEEVYIPANIISTAPGVLDKLEGLMYIEVAPDNPVYESRDGILYGKNSEIITVPAGRK